MGEGDQGWFRPVRCDEGVILRKHAQRMVKSFASGLDRVRPPDQGVTILIYHRVGGGTEGEVDLDPEVFEAQMAALSGRAVSLDAALEGLATREESDDLNGTVVVTFDDGTPDVVETALPICRRHGVPVMLYLATAFVEEGRPFWSDDDRPLSWGALSEAVAEGGLEVGSHTHTHVLMDRMSPREVADELDRSIELIGDRLGVQARHFAYPKSVPPAPAADRAVRQRFVSAALGGTRANTPTATDPHRLWRSPIQRSDGMDWFAAKSYGGLGFEDRVRTIVNRGRYARATS